MIKKQTKVNHKSVDLISGNKHFYTFYFCFLNQIFEVLKMMLSTRGKYFFVLF